jgi:hypothetical protein
MLLRGKHVRLRGKTQRGKNRIRRAGSDEFIVVGSGQWGMFLQSAKVGQKEAFWMSETRDEHMEVIDG